MTQSDERRLAEYLEQRLPGVHITDVARLEGVVTSKIWIAVGDQPSASGQTSPTGIVIRAHDPNGPLAFGALSKDEEYRLLLALSGAGISVPRPYFADQGDNPLGVPLFVMERAPGSPQQDLLAADDPFRARIVAQLAGHLAGVHALDWPSMDLDFVSVPVEGSASLKWFEGWYRYFLANVEDHSHLYGRVADWLIENAPVSEAPVLCWGDPGPGNFLVHESSISVLLDWELAHIGERADDLGFLVWRITEHFGSEACDPGRLINEYEIAADVDIRREDVDYFTVMAYCKTSIWAALSLLGARRSAASRSLESHPAAIRSECWIEAAADRAGVR
jgi:aminoglycoside phosphotransferase (APT) family kinase protein